MLTYGYENTMLSCWCVKLKLDAILTLLETWDIVGNALKPNSDEPAVGKDMSVNSKSFCHTKLFSKFVNELFWINWGNPHDMGVTDAYTGMAGRVSNTAVTITTKIFFSLIRLSSKYSISRHRLIHWAIN